MRHREERERARRGSVALLGALVTLSVAHLPGCARPHAQEPTVQGPSWLTDLSVGDRLIYHVERLDEAGVVAEVEVARLVRRGVGVAALLWPSPETARDLGFRSRWLAADDHAIYQLVSSRETLDPQFLPLNSDGRVVVPNASEEEPSSEASPAWSLPHALRPDQSSLGGGWELDELDFQLEGPVRGDRCARLRRPGERDQATSVVVCANVGIVQVLVAESEMTVRERWQLVEIRRRVGAGEGL